MACVQHSNATLTKLSERISTVVVGCRTVNNCLLRPWMTRFTSQLRRPINNADQCVPIPLEPHAWVIEDIRLGSDVFGTEAGYYGSGWSTVCCSSMRNGVSGDPRSMGQSCHATAWELQSSDSTLSDGHLHPTRPVAALRLPSMKWRTSAQRRSTGHELWAYNTSNETAWLVATNTGSTTAFPEVMLTVLGDTLYFSIHPVSSLTMSLCARRPTAHRHPQPS